MSTHSQAPGALRIDPALSLWPLVDRWETVSVFANYKGVLTTISHEIETGVRNSSSRPQVFSGFQKLSLFLPQVERYRRLARSAGHIWVFGVFDVIPPSIPGITYVQLAESDTLASEWFIIANGADFFSALVAQDLSGFSIPDAQRQFRGVWTFEAELVQTLYQQICLALGQKPLTKSQVGRRDYSRHLATIASSASRLVDTLETRNQTILRQQKMQEDFTQMLVHDLRNPLTNIIGSLDMVVKSRDLEPADQMELVASSLQSSRRMANMVSSILDVGKMEDGQFVLNKEKTSLLAFMEGVIQRWAIPVRYIGKTLVVNFPEEDVQLDVDVAVLGRVLDNLVGNAIKFGSRIVVESQVAQGRVSFIVRDNGKGITAADLPHIFEKYRQGGSQADRSKGTGLGLAFCKLAVEGHGGQISAATHPEGGAVFTVTLNLS